MVFYIGLIPYQLIVGLDGRFYAVFRNSLDAQDAIKRKFFKGCSWACWNQYENALCLE